MAKNEDYPSTLNDKEWALLEPLFPGQPLLGRPPKYSKRMVVNAIFYMVRSGCAWRMMPKDLPPWRVCYYYFQSWTRRHTWEKIHDHLRDMVRAANGKKNSLPLRLSTRRALKVLITEECVAMMLANASKAASGTYSWIPSEWC